MDSDWFLSSRPLKKRKAFSQVQQTLAEVQTEYEKECSFQCDPKTRFYQNYIIKAGSVHRSRSTRRSKTKRKFDNLLPR